MKPIKISEEKKGKNNVKIQIKNNILIPKVIINKIRNELKSNNSLNFFVILILL